MPEPIRPAWATHTTTWRSGDLEDVVTLLEDQGLRVQVLQLHGEQPELHLCFDDGQCVTLRDPALARALGRAVAAGAVTLAWALAGTRPSA